MRERGLKHSRLSLVGKHIMSLPMRERGLKLVGPLFRVEKLASLPMRERGLKQERAKGGGF